MWRWHDYASVYEWNWPATSNLTWKWISTLHETNFGCQDHSIYSGYSGVLYFTTKTCRRIELFKSLNLESTECVLSIICEYCILAALKWLQLVIVFHYSRYKQNNYVLIVSLNNMDGSYGWQVDGGSYGYLQKYMHMCIHLGTTFEAKFRRNVEFIERPFFFIATIEPDKLP